jgi:hypothetical protein
MDNKWIQLSSQVGFFGDGGNHENGIRSNSNVLYAAAVLVAHSDELGIDRQTTQLLRSRTKSLINYLTRSHRTGTGECANGHQWGLEWQSSWWSAKIALGSYHIWSSLDDDERERVSAVVLAEASRQLDRVAPTGLFLDTKAEENAWDCEILACAIALFTDHPDRERWYDKLTEFSANVFSSPHDRRCSQVLDGQPIASRVYTCNVHGDYSLENHGAFHFCYVASPILSKAWCYLALRLGGVKEPEALYHNVRPVWRLAQNLFLVNRFAYIGGQDWARYTYGEYFIVPSLLFLAQLQPGGPELHMLRAKLRILFQETSENADGSFFGRRFTYGRFEGQYAKYETDCFCSLALSWSLSQLLDLTGISNKCRSEYAPTTAHVSPEGQFWFARGVGYFVSFSWATLAEEVPNINFVNLEDDSLAEWHAGNLVGTVKTLGQCQPVWVRSIKAVGSNLVAQGTGLYRSKGGKPLFELFLSVEFDTARKVLKVKARYVARSRLWLAQITGLMWRIPNDTFNGSVRRLFGEFGSRELRPLKTGRTRRFDSLFRRALRRLGIDGSSDERLPSAWVNVDGRIGLALRDKAEITVRSFAEKASTWNSLYVHQFEAPKRHLLLHAKAGAILLETESLIHIGGAEQTRDIATVGFK